MSNLAQANLFRIAAEKARAEASAYREVLRFVRLIVSGKAVPLDAKKAILLEIDRVLAPIEAFGRDAQRLDGEATKAGKAPKNKGIIL